MKGEHFVNAFTDLEKANQSPIHGYQHLSISTLEDATEKLHSLVPGITDYVQEAKKNCNRSSNLLTVDESAAIYLYTMPISFFSQLNEKLRAKNRHELKPWFAFLNLFITALDKLPSVQEIVWRGVVGDVGRVFDDGDIHIWWNINSCSLDIYVVEKYLENTGTLFAIKPYHGKNISQYSAFPLEEEVVLMPGTRLHAKSHSVSIKDSFFLIHLEEESNQGELQSESNYFINLIKQKYRQDNRISRLMNPSISFPIEQSYINLSIVETAEQLEKEKKLCDARYNSDIIDTFEEIYGMKTKIEIKNIFDKCQHQTKKVILLGRAGIGKTTFCRYAAHQWATGYICQEYDLVIWISLRNLTESRYPPLTSNIRYSLIDIVKTEYYFHDIDPQYEQTLKETLSNKQILWLLDGYDEIAQNVPEYLKYLLQELIQTKHHVLTSRPYLNDLSYDVELEITGFTDDNVDQYVKLFFDQIKDKVNSRLDQTQRLLDLLKHNPRIWGIAHIPVILELICTVWCNTAWNETSTMTITHVYDQMIEWLCRRYSDKQNSTSLPMRKRRIFERCNNELSFLEALAFIGMKENVTVLLPELLEKAERLTQISLDNNLYFLNIGILKSFDNRPISTRIETDKNHYFVHLSFQEHFAARYLVNALKHEHKKTEAIDCIKTHKYNQRFESVLSFTSGLIMEYGNNESINLFWEALLSEPSDLIGVKHVQVILACLEEAKGNTNIAQYDQIVSLIIKWIKYSVCARYNYSYDIISTCLQRFSFATDQSEIFNNDDITINKNAYMMISQLPIFNSGLQFIPLHLKAFDFGDPHMTIRACESIAEIGSRIAIPQVTDKLMNLLDSTNQCIKTYARTAIEKMGGQVFNDPFHNKILDLSDNPDQDVRDKAWKTIERCNERIENRIVSVRLVGSLNSLHPSLQNTDAIAGEKAVTDEVITTLFNSLNDSDEGVRSNACEIVGKMGERVATVSIIDKVRVLLNDTSPFVRQNACIAAKKMGKKLATTETIEVMLRLLKDPHNDVQNSAVEFLKDMNDKIATNEAVFALLDAYNNMDWRPQFEITKIIKKIFDLTSSVSYLCEDTVRKLASVIENCNRDFLKTASLEKFIKAFIDTDYNSWLPIIKDVCIVQGCAVTLTANVVELHGNRESVQLPIKTIECSRKFREYFGN